MASEDFGDILEAVEFAAQNVCDHVQLIAAKFPSIVELEEKLSAHLRVKGVDHVDHPISQELERVKLYMKKVIQIRQAQETVSEDQLRPKIDAEVVERVVRFYTQSNTSKDERSKRSNQSVTPGLQTQQAEPSFVGAVQTEPPFVRKFSEDEDVALKSSEVSKSKDAQIFNSIILTSSSEDECVYEPIGKSANKKRKMSLEKEKKRSPSLERVDPIIVKKKKIKKIKRKKGKRSEHATSDHVSTSPVPRETVPSETVPSKTVPSETVPINSLTTAHLREDGHRKRRRKRKRRSSSLSLKVIKSSDSSPKGLNYS